MAESNWRIVMLGKTGVGKSSVANTIFGEQLFKTNSTADSETRKCQAETKSVHGRSFTLIDTPGFFNTDESEELKTEIVRCITDFAPGPHAFLIVLEVKKSTEQDQAVITKIKQYFSEEVFKYATVLFTHGDQLDEGQTVDEVFHQNQLVKDLVKKCGGRCHVLDNKYWENNQPDEYRSNQFQVKELLKTIDEMVEANKGSCYTNEMLQAVEEEIHKEEELIRQSSGNMSKEEVREQAKDIFKRLMIKLAGIATGVLLGALFGGATMVAEVLLMWKKNLSEPGHIKSLANIAVKAAAVIGAVGAAAAAVGGAAAGGGAAAAGGAVVGAVGAAAAAVVGGAAAVGGAVIGAVGAAAAAVGGAAAAGGAVVSVVAAAGAVKGGVAGYHAAEGADSPREAAQRAAKTARDRLSVFKRLCSKDETEC